ARLGHERPRLDASGGAVEPHHGIDHLEIFEPHRANSSSPTNQALAAFSATSASMRAQRFFSTKYCSAGTLPSLTSWVHRSSGSLIPKALSTAKAMSRKASESMPRSSMAW